MIGCFFLKELYFFKSHPIGREDDLSYIFSMEEISTCIPGVKSIEQLRSNVGASQIKFTNDELKRVEEIQQNWHEGISRTG